MIRTKRMGKYSRSCIRRQVSDIGSSTAKNTSITPTSSNLCRVIEEEKHNKWSSLLRLVKERKYSQIQLEIICDSNVEHCECVCLNDGRDTAIVKMMGKSKM